MNKIVTISRELGSGGREIGKRLADQLGILYYDREIITEIAKQTGMTEEYIKKVAEKGISPYTFHFGKTFTLYSKMQSDETEILVKEQQIIKDIAKKGDCVIVGRGANIILKEYNPIKIFVYADIESKIKRCHKQFKQGEQLTDKEIEDKIKEVDKNRRKYNNLISKLEWGDKRNYNLCINTSNIEIKSIILPLAQYIEQCFRGNN